MSAAERLKRVAARALINLATYEAVEEVARALLRELRRASEEEIWEAAQANVSLVDLMDERWERRARRVAALVRAKGLASEVVRAIDKVTTERVLKVLLLKAYEAGDDELVRKLWFIINSPTCVRWVDYNVKRAKEYFAGLLRRTPRRS